MGFSTRSSVAVFVSHSGNTSRASVCTARKSSKNLISASFFFFPFFFSRASRASRISHAPFLVSLSSPVGFCLRALILVIVVVVVVLFSTSSMRCTLSSIIIVIVSPSLFFSSFIFLVLLYNALTAAAASIISCVSLFVCVRACNNT